MLSVQRLVRSCAPTAFAAMTARRFQGNLTGGNPADKSSLSSTDPTYEDDRWLEATISTSAEMTQEERYAALKQREIMKKMLEKVREEHKEVVEEVKDTHAAEVEALKKKLATLEKKVKPAASATKKAASAKK